MESINDLSAVQGLIQNEFFLRLKLVLSTEEPFVRRSEIPALVEQAISLGPLSRAALRIERSARRLCRAIVSMMDRDVLKEVFLFTLVLAAIVAALLLVIE